MLFSVEKLIRTLIFLFPYQATSQKHLRMILDNRLSFEGHLRLIFNKISKTIGLLRKIRCHTKIHTSDYM